MTRLAGNKPKKGKGKGGKAKKKKKWNDKIMSELVYSFNFKFDK
jgi:ribosomal protein S25